jgi:hypothetical protein
VRDSRKLPQWIREAERAIREQLFSTSPIGPPEQRAFKVVRNSVIGFVYDVRTKICFVSTFDSAQYRALEVAYEINRGKSGVRFVHAPDVVASTAFQSLKSYSFL